ncbi:hypothetical protein PI125_g4647 [Phytophthora idaei]|nr:hypothetical protein PI125_g4647 [Phytophthora idaei]KAG3150142.1 hypothetical protein PI126_g11662 [Phytophthora idaei]
MKRGLRRTGGREKEDSDVSSPHVALQSILTATELTESETELSESY